MIARNSGTISALLRFIPLDLPIQLLTCFAVREARRHHSIRIVSLDWLEDSLLSASRRPLNTVKYEFEPRKARSSAKRRAARKDREDSHTKKEHSQDGTAGDEGGNSANGKKQESSWKRKSDKQKKRKREDTDDLSLSKDERVEISGMSSLLLLFNAPQRCSRSMAESSSCG